MSLRKIKWWKLSEMRWWERAAFFVGFVVGVFSLTLLVGVAGMDPSKFGSGDLVLDDLPVSIEFPKKESPLEEWTIPHPASPVDFNICWYQTTETYRGKWRGVSAYVATRGALTDHDGGPLYIEGRPGNPDETWWLLGGTGHGRWVSPCFDVTIPLDAVPVGGEPDTRTVTVFAQLDFEYPTITGGEWSSTVEREFALVVLTPDEEARRAADRYEFVARTKREGIPLWASGVGVGLLLVLVPSLMLWKRTRKPRGKEQEQETG